MLVGTILALAPAGVVAANDGPKLALTPIGQSGSFFDITLSPGDSASYSIQLANDGGADAAVRTYLADVYTIVNGGFGGRLRDEPISGTSRWIEYPTDVMDLAPGDRVTRELTVTVPLNAAPGEYISAIFLENEVPVSADGSLGMDQVVRQAVAVALTVPGARAPAAAIGRAVHKVVAAGSVLQVALANTGNVRLHPLVSFTIDDASGTTVGTANVALDTFYSHTHAFMEIPLATPLAPGTYRVHLRLTDAAEPALNEGAELTLSVTSSTGGESPGAEAVPGIGEWISGAVVPGELLGTTAALVVVAMAVLLVRRRRRSARLDSPACARR